MLRGLNATTTLTMPGGGRCSVRITLGPGPTSRGISPLRPLSSSPVQTCRAFDLVFSSPGPLVFPQGDRETAPVYAPHVLPVIYAPQEPVSSSPRPIRARTPPCPGRVTPGTARAWGEGTLENEPPIQCSREGNMVKSASIILGSSVSQLSPTAEERTPCRKASRCHPCGKPWVSGWLRRQDPGWGSADAGPRVWTVNRPVASRQGYKRKEQRQQILSKGVSLV